MAIKEMVSTSFTKEFKFQGYKSPNQHKYDIRTLAALQKNGIKNLSLIKNIKKRKLADSELTEKLELGKSSKKCKPLFTEKLEEVRNKIAGGRQYNPRKDGTLHFWNANLGVARLKGAKRIHAKSLIYKSSRETDLSLIVNQVRDVLRATISFETVDKLLAWCGGPGAGSNIIDLIDSKLPVLRVKNRFTGAPLPKAINGDLSTIEKLYEAKTFQLDPKLKGQARITRDSFYRDIQLLVCLNGNQGFDASPFKYHIAEVQITVDTMAAAKKVGHHTYENLRQIDGYIELKRAYERSKDIRFVDMLKEAMPDQKLVASFPRDTKEMADVYRKALKGDQPPKNLRDVIDNSKWSKKGIRKK